VLPRIVIDFFLDNQPDALIIQIYSELRSILTLLGSGRPKPAWNLPVPNVQ